MRSWINRATSWTPFSECGKKPKTRVNSIPPKSKRSRSELSKRNQSSKFNRPTLSYNPTVVYGPPGLCLSPNCLPPPPPRPSTGAVIATAAVGFGVGVMMDAMWSGCCHGGYGWGCGWGGNNTVVINNNFNNRYGYANVNRNTNISNTNISRGNRVAARGGNTNSWQHNPDHRRAVPYSDRSTTQRFGGSTRDSSGRTERFDRSGQPSATQADRRTDRAAADRGRQDTRDLGGGRDAG